MREQAGEIHIEVIGSDLSQLHNESGNHRLQRIPPTERKGRVHTSSITIAVLDTAKFRASDYSTIDQADLKIEWYSGTGAGGQNRNKVQASCRLTHIPTGIVKTSQCRSRETSYREAYEQLIKILQSDAHSSQLSDQSVERKRQMGSGQRADNKVRTYRFQDDIATDSRSGKKVSLSKVMRGYFDLLW